MIIRKLTACYGKLNGEALTLLPGLNIICAPNESGKSTWCSFIKSMLYGVDSSAREKGGVKPDKLRFAPWSGANMSGSMELFDGARELTLSRSGRESAPLREVSLVYTGTAQAFEDLREPVGDSLLGISREVFERSAFISQGAVMVSAGPELEKRIAAIVQTGDEGASFSEAEEKLRAAMRARRHNKSGALPELERERAAATAQLGDLALELERGLGLKTARERALFRRDELSEKLRETRENRRKASINILNESQKNIAELELALSAALENAAGARGALAGSLFGDCSPKLARERAMGDIDEIARLDAEKSAAEKKRAKYIVCRALTLGIIALALIITRVFFPAGFTLAPISAALVLALTAVFITAKQSRKAKRRVAEADKAQQALYAKYSCRSPDEILGRLTEHEALFNSREKKSAEAFFTRERLEGEREKRRSQEAFAACPPESPDAPIETAEDTRLDRELAEARENLSRVLKDCAVNEGRLEAMGDKAELEEKIGRLNLEHKRLTLEYEALFLAAETLSAAGTEIQNRLTPRLSARTGEIFARLTRSRYDGVALDRELKALARLSGDTLARDSSFLSVGALDQLYLAVRLAICELALPEGKAPPLILDDALGSFDDERCKAALDFLREVSQSRQVLLFSCHGREASMMSGFEDVNIIDYREDTVL